MWSLRLLALLLCCYGCLAAGRVEPCERPFFISTNFHNVLHWRRAEPARPGEDVRYTVQYWSDTKEQPFRNKAECRNISALSCDLTAETASLPHAHYVARVHSSGRHRGARTSYRFNPIAHTDLGPPILSLSPTVSSLCVDVSLPPGPNATSMLDVFNRTRSVSFRPLVLYTLHITQPRWAARVNQSTTGRFAIDLKNNGTEFCGFVVYTPGFLPGRPASHNTTFCVTLPADRWMLLPWFLAAAALLSVPVMLSTVLICRYASGKATSIPGVLDQMANFAPQPQVLTPPDQNLSISKFEILPPGKEKAVSAVQVNPTVPPAGSGGYSPQNAQIVPDLAWDSGSCLGSGLSTLPSDSDQDTSNQSSDIYSAVGVQVPGEQAGGLQQCRNEVHLAGTSLLRRPCRDTERTGQKAPSPGTPPSTDSGGSNQDGSLLLRTLRNSNGQLVLPLFPFQARTRGNAVDGGRSAPHPVSEWKPLLSDLGTQGTPRLLLSLHSVAVLEEGSDSGSDQSTGNSPTELSLNLDDCPATPFLSALPPGGPTSYMRHHAQSNSGYKHNWMPTVSDYRPLRGDPREYEDNGEEYEEGGEEEEGRRRSGRSFWGAGGCKSRNEE